MTDDVLRRAERLFSRRRFAEAIRILEPQIYRFRESFDFYHLLGRSCIRTGDIAGAYSYLRRAEQLRPGDAGVLQLMAAIYHRRGERERALETYLEVLEASPGDRWARRGLDQLQHEFRDDAGAGGRRGGGQVAIDRLLPPLPFRVPAWLWIAAAAMFASVAVLAGIRLLGQPAEEADARPGLAEVQLPGPDPEFVVAGARAGPFTLTDAEVEEAFDSAKRLLGAYRENEARIEMNRILLSNATEAVKTRVRRLDAFFTVPDFSTIGESLSLTEVIAAPRLHEGVYVAWPGLVANVAVGETAITFDLLVGYHRREVLEGRVRVVVPFAHLIDNGEPFEVLGRVAVSEAGLVLNAVSLHDLPPVRGGSASP